MKCCTHDCNQGRDCPARVAKVGRRYPGAAALGCPIWRRQVRELARWVLALIGAGAVLMLVAIASGLAGGR